MKLKFILRTLLVCIIGSLSLSCSEDDGGTLSCRTAEVSMKINGELHTYINSGYGIDMIWGTNGHELTLWFDRDGMPNENMILTMRYKKTGHNVIDALSFDHFDENHTGEYNLINENIDTHVKINRHTCFYATFSGTFMAGGEEMTVTDGIISVVYDDPLSQQ
ncbi:hypothetical protein [Flavobacterium sp.]|uniref:hypothetical protein n=1 Tax=Flavobacterium sp. TaxID=239 RepID=UPI0040347F43